jgi:hypothetical protein
MLTDDDDNDYNRVGSGDSSSSSSSSSTEKSWSWIYDRWSVGQSVLVSGSRPDFCFLSMWATLSDKRMDL